MLTRPQKLDVTREVAFYPLYLYNSPPRSPMKFLRKTPILLLLTWPIQLAGSTPEINSITSDAGETRVSWTLGEAAFVDLERSTDDSNDVWDVVLKCTNLTSISVPTSSPSTRYRLARPLKWTITTIDRSTGSGRYSSLIINPEGRAVISYDDDTMRCLKVATEQSPKWHVEIVDRTCTPAATSLAYSPSGRLSIAYFATRDHDLKFAEKDAKWSIETIDREGFVGDDASLAFDSAGMPAIAYWDGTNGWLKYASRKKGVWSSTQAVRGGEYPSLRFDRRDHPTISHRGKNRLEFATFDGNAWTTDPVGGHEEGGYHSSMAYDGTGSPVIAHWAKSDRCLLLETRKAGGWSTTIVDNSGNAGRSASFKFNPSGLAAISYCDEIKITNAKLKYAIQTASGWLTSIVDENVGAGYQTSLAFGADGLPAISYYDVENRNLKFARLVPF